MHSPTSSFSSTTFVDDTSRVDGSAYLDQLEQMSNDAPPVPADGKRVFVTIGATAPFNALIRGCLAHGFLQALKDHNFTELRFQWGKDGIDNLKDASLENIKSTYGIDVTGFDFKESITWEIAALRNQHTDHEGLLIVHGGSGSVLEAMRSYVPFIVVPNPDLLHNHQVELAEEMENLKYGVYGKLSDLPAAIPRAEKHRKVMRQWPPVTSQSEKTKKGLKGVMDEEMGWEG